MGREFEVTGMLKDGYGRYGRVGCRVTAPSPEAAIKRFKQYFKAGLIRDAIAVPI